MSSYGVEKVPARMRRTSIFVVWNDGGGSIHFGASGSKHIPSVRHSPSVIHSPGEKPRATHIHPSHSAGDF